MTKADILRDKNIQIEVVTGRYILLAGSTKWIGHYHLRIIPNYFHLILNNIRISIIAGHIVYKDNWIMQCPDLDMKEIECRNCETATQSAEYALKIVRNKLSNMLQDLDNLKQQ